MSGTDPSPGADAGSARSGARGRLAAGDERVVTLDVDGLPVRCTVPADDSAPGGATAFNLLAGALSACTAMSVRTFLQRWERAGTEVEVDVFIDPGPPMVLERRVQLTAALDAGLREQLASVVDSTPVTVLLRDALIIVTHLDVRAP